MERIKKNFKGIVTSMAGGLVASAALLLLLFLIGLITNEFQLFFAVRLMRSGILIVTALFLLVVAGLILTKKHAAPFQNSEKWKKYFGTLNFATALVFFILPMILTAAIVDYILIYAF